MTTNSQQKMPGPIPTLNPRHKEQRGYRATSTVNLKQKMDKQRQEPVPAFNWGSPVTCGEHILVASNNEGSTNYIACVDSNALKGHMKNDPLVSVCSVDKTIWNIEWVQPSLAVGGLADGELQLYSIAESEDKTIQVVGSITGHHTGDIREVSKCHTSPNLIATASWDKHVAITDLAANNRLLQKADQKGVVGSVSWFNNQDILSLTTDHGEFRLLDTRSDLQQRVVDICTKKQALFSHCVYSSNHVLLGFGDGNLQHWDMRNTSQPLQEVQDPYVDGIGAIQYNPSVDAFVTSGFTDFTVWTIKNGEARVWSHKAQGSDAAFNESGLLVGATWMNDTTIVGSAVSNVGLWVQNWDASYQ